ncbi:MAG: RNA polymerase sigma-70 factor [Sphingobacterium sp.]|nr:RNA polymerase sigma-70 factor [Sphingobacterium sp.]
MVQFDLDRYSAVFRIHFFVGKVKTAVSVAVAVWFLVILHLHLANLTQLLKKLNDYQAISDIELLHLSAKDDQAAFAELFNRYKVSIFQHAFLFYQDYDKAQDVVQELFLKLWQKRSEIKVQSSLKSYIHKATRHLILNQLAHGEVVERFNSYYLHTHSDGTNEVEEKLQEKELLEILQQKVELMPKKMQKIFKMSREEELSHKEISEKLNIAPKTVRQQIYNALLILKNNLKYLFLFFFH